MPRFSAVVEKIDRRQAVLLLDDGVRIPFPIERLPQGTVEGTILQISVSVDRLALLLRKSSKQLAPKGV